MLPYTTLAMTFGERAAYSLKMFIIGQGTVFVALAVLWGALVLFRHLAVKKPKPAPAPAAPAAPVAPAPAAAPAGQAEAAQGDDALIAVITAAVAAAMADENNGELPAFRVVSFRRL